MLPNPYKCEVEFRDADGVAHKLALSMDVSARLEAKYDEHITEVLRRLSDSPRMVFVMEVLGLMLVGDYSADDAARIWGRLGWGHAVALLDEAIRLSMKEEFGEGEEVPQNGSRPPKAGRKIGPPSSPTVSAPV